MSEDEPSSSRALRRRYSFWLVLGGAAIARLVDHATEGASLLYPLVGVLAGIGWHLSYRRDLADRLALFAEVTVAVAILSVIPAWTTDGPTAPGLLYCLGVIAGLVVTERGFRWREQVHAKRTPSDQ